MYTKSKDATALAAVSCLEERVKIAAPRRSLPCLSDTGAGDCLTVLIDADQDMHAS